MNWAATGAAIVNSSGSVAGSNFCCVSTVFGTFVLMQNCLLGVLILTAFTSGATERKLDFGASPLNRPPSGFRSTVTGQGERGDWQVIQNEVPSLLEPLTRKAPQVSRQTVLAQLSAQRIDYHFPLLLLDGESYGDFTLSSRVKTMSGTIDQLAGLVFRYQNESNYYALFVNSRDNRFRFFKVVDGMFSPQMGPETPVGIGQWHEIVVQCDGNHIHCLLDGQERIPMITDNSFHTGRVGFFTKSDTVACFADAKITYMEKEILAQKIVREALKEYPRVLGLKIYARPALTNDPVVVASNDPKEDGHAAGKAELDVIARGTRYIARAKEFVTVTVPLHDRNGDPIAAVSLTLKSFPGQTEENALARAQPIVQRLQANVQSLEDLVQ